MTAATDLAIRARRAAFNRAIAEADIAAIGPLLARDCVMMTGTDSAVVAGRNAQLKLWRREFAAAQRSIYSRIPNAVTVSAVEPLALEQGDWQGRDLAGTLIAQGAYSAKWRLLGGDWVIEAEIYITLA